MELIKKREKINLKIKKGKNFVSDFGYQRYKRKEKKKQNIINIYTKDEKEKKFQKFKLKKKTIVFNYLTSTTIKN